MIYMVLGLLVATVCVVLGWHYLRSYRETTDAMALLMEKGLPQVFTDRMNTIVSERNLGGHEPMILISMAAATSLSGEFQDSIVQLEKIETAHFKSEERGYYYTCLAHSLLLMDAVDQADEIFKHHIGEMIAAERNSMARNGIKTVKALMEMKLGHMDHAEKLFTELYQQRLTNLERAMVAYWMGNLMERNNRPGALDYYRECQTRAGETIYQTWSSRKLELSQSDYGKLAYGKA